MPHAAHTRPQRPWGGCNRPDQAARRPVATKLLSRDDHKNRSKPTRSADLAGKAGRRVGGERRRARPTPAALRVPTRAESMADHLRVDWAGQGSMGMVGGHPVGTHISTHAQRGHTREVGAAANRAAAKPLRRQAVATSTHAAHTGQQRRRDGRRGRDRRTGCRSGSEGRRWASSCTKSLQKKNARGDRARRRRSACGRHMGGARGCRRGRGQRRGAARARWVRRAVVQRCSAQEARDSTRPMSSVRVRCTRWGGAHRGRLIRISAVEDVRRRRRRRTRTWA